MNSNGWTNFQKLKVFSWFGPLEKECDLIALLAFLGHCPSLEKIDIDVSFTLCFPILIVYKTNSHNVIVLGGFTV